MTHKDPWIAKVEQKIKNFASEHSLTYSRTQREIAASFEIGCFHALVDFYTINFTVKPKDLTENNEYRYLTTPSGNPKNFSYVKLEHSSGEFELRQQVRIRSHLHEDISFTPDLVVLKAGANINVEKDKDFAGGKRSFFIVGSHDIVAAHECKSMNPFPELLISFVGVLMAAHAWLEHPTDKTAIAEDGIHLAPSLFVGGTARALHARMIAALETCYPINVVLGLHVGTWSLLGSARRLNMLALTPTPELV